MKTVHRNFISMQHVLVKCVDMEFLFGQNPTIRNALEQRAWLCEVIPVVLLMLRGNLKILYILVLKNKTKHKNPKKTTTTKKKRLQFCYQFYKEQIQVLYFVFFSTNMISKYKNHKYIDFMRLWSCHFTLLFPFFLLQKVLK